MATTSLWRVTARLDKVVNYTENNEKTDNPAFKPPSEEAELEKVIGYAVQEAKTKIDSEEELLAQFVTAIECDPNNAFAEMTATKRRWGKTGGTLAYHGYQSFAPGEATPEIAHEIGVKLAQRLWGDRYQVVIATHLDKAHHLHSHFVINTVSYVDGKKFFRSAKDYAEMRRVSDELCREYGLSVIENPATTKEHYAEWNAKQEGKPSHRQMIRTDIDNAILSCNTRKALFKELAKLGYEFKFYGKSGKPLAHPTLKPPGASRFFRFDTLGEDYSLSMLDRRLLGKNKKEPPFPPEEQEKLKQYREKTQPAYHQHVTGLRGLYLRYCYELKIIVKAPASAQRVPYSMRQDIIKMERLDRETRLLADHQIDTGKQLAAYKDGLTRKISQLCGERKDYRAELRRAVRQDKTEQAGALRKQIATLSEELKKLRREVSLCEDIANRSQQVREDLERLSEESKNLERKEKSKDELFR